MTGKALCLYDEKGATRLLSGKAQMFRETTQGHKRREPHLKEKEWGEGDY